MAVLYLLDANVLITAKNLYYEFGRVDQYWEWLAFQAEQGHAKIPIEIFEEITVGKDELSTWAKSNKDALVLDEAVDIDHVQRVTLDGYAPDLTDIELEVIGRDPFLIAYALADVENRIIVTGEVRSKKQRQNRPIPSVCDEFGVKSCDQWQFGRALDFKTDWERP
jgi:hypothetical protein